jgi:hypothetical protein
MLPRAALLVASASLALAGQAGAEERGTYRTFRDWIAACDNTRSCRAFALPSDSDPVGIALGIARGGDPEAAPDLTLHFTDQEQVRNAGRVTIATEAGPVATLVIGEGLIVDENVYAITDKRAAAAILAAARRSRDLRLTFDPPMAGPDGGTLRISLDGASAALLWIDDRQKRVGTVTALARHGARPASAVPKPVVPAPPAARPATGGAAPAELAPAALEATMAAFRRIPDDHCNQDDPDRDGPSIDRLAPNLLLVGIRCWRGAYNFSRAYYFVEEGDRPNVRPASFPRPFTLPRTPDAEAAPDNILWNADFSPAMDSIGHFSKGRGIGDCGERGEWAWTGRAFEPVSLSLMPTCRGIDPGSWFTLYRTR